VCRRIISEDDVLRITESEEGYSSGLKSPEKPKVRTSDVCALLSPPPPVIPCPPPLNVAQPQYRNPTSDTL
jgi:hypothetical protein